MPPSSGSHVAVRIGFENTATILDRIGTEVRSITHEDVPDDIACPGYGVLHPGHSALIHSVGSRFSLSEDGQPLAVCIRRQAGNPVVLVQGIPMQVRQK
jgi:hypothetical protein